MTETTLIAPHPFGDTVTRDTLIARFPARQSWEEKYRQLIQLARLLPPLPEALKSAEHEVGGCENRVWFGWQALPDGRLHFWADSDGRIVKGLLAILLTQIEGKTAAELAAEAPLALFDALSLSEQLSTTRQQGLAALAQAVQRAAASAAGK